MLRVLRGDITNYVLWWWSRGIVWWVVLLLLVVVGLMALRSLCASGEMSLKTNQSQFKQVRRFSTRQTEYPNHLLLHLSLHSDIASTSSLTRKMSKLLTSKCSSNSSSSSSSSASSSCALVHQCLCHSVFVTHFYELS